MGEVTLVVTCHWLILMMYLSVCYILSTELAGQFYVVLLSAHPKVLNCTLYKDVHYCSYGFIAYLNCVFVPFVKNQIIDTILVCFLAHAPLSEYAPLLEYRRMEVNCNIYNIGAPVFSIISQNVFFSATGACTKKHDYMVLEYFQPNQVQ